MADLVQDGIAIYDKVYDLALGAGYVRAVNATAALPITCIFRNGKMVIQYNRAGELYAGSLQTLYFAPPTISAYTAIGRVTSWETITAGRLIQVSTDNATFIPAYFVSYTATNPSPFLAADTVPSTAANATYYPYAKL